MSASRRFISKRERGESSFKRQKAKREPYDTVLIVCEGTKTEPNYFEGLKKAYGLSSANILICEDKHGSDPRGIVKCAVEKIKLDSGFDRVYCVFDRDKHPTFNDAIQILQGKYRKKLFRSLSIPCFEIWLLLHFKYTTRQFCVAAVGSDCDEVISELKTFIPDYQKGKEDIFGITKERTDFAIKNAKRLVKHQQDSRRSLGDQNPLTEIYELVEYLMNLKK
jgi:hypothetical protein